MHPVIEEVEVTIPAFKVISVFDVSQTSGKELPTLGVDELKGDVNNYEKLFEALKRIAPVPVYFEAINGGAKGYFDKDKNSIAINKGMSEVQTVKTAIHEIAHSILHNHNMIKADVDKPKDRNTEEVEAESIAYTVCQHFGIDTSDYSFAYVASWGSGKEVPELKASLETIRSTANDIINKAEDILLGRQKEQVQAKDQKQDHFSAVSLPKVKDEFNIIGNVPYMYIPYKTYLRLPTETALAVSRLLEEKGIKFSGRVSDDKTTLTISRSDISAYNKALEEVRNSKVEDNISEPKVSVEYHPYLDDGFILKEVATGGTLYTGTKQELIDFCEKNLAASVVIPLLVDMIDKAQAERPIIDHFDIPIYMKTVKEAKNEQFSILRSLMNDCRVTEVINACDAGREGELIFRLVYNKAGCQKPIKRLWISSMEEKAILDGFADLKDGKDYDKLYNSALCRAKADWIVGINATRLFSRLYNAVNESYLCQKCIGTYKNNVYY